MVSSTKQRDANISDGGIGGTAGCTIAGRLAEADPGLSVLLIEGGENHEGKDSVKHPILMALNLMPDSKTTVAYPGKKADAVNGRAITVHTGGVLGGGSSVNFMLSGHSLPERSSDGTDRRQLLSCAGH